MYALYILIIYSQDMYTLLGSYISLAVFLRAFFHVYFLKYSNVTESM